jgi:hypothetical protein
LLSETVSTQEEQSFFDYLQNAGLVVAEDMKRRKARL